MSEPADSARDVLVDAARFFRDELADSWVPDYLISRGLGCALRYRWGTGYAPEGWQTLIEALRLAGHANTAIEASGLVARSRNGRLYARFRDRVMFPMRDGSGQLVGFIGRAHPDADRDVPKWLNPPQTVLYNKSDQLYGIHEGLKALEMGATLVIVEGVLDAIAITEAGKGTMAGVAGCGTALTRAHVEVIEAVACGPVVVAYDPDQAGRKATARSWKTLHAAGIDAVQADLPGGADPALTLELHGPAVLTEAITNRARPLVQAALQAAIEPWIDQLDEVEARVAAMRSTIPILAQLEPAAAADQIVQLAGQLGITADALTGDGGWLDELVSARPIAGGWSPRPLAVSCIAGAGSSASPSSG